MIYSLKGQLTAVRENFAVVDVGGIGFKVFISFNAAQSLPQVGGNVNLFCYLHMRENGVELYGFSSEQELNLFEKLNSVTGIGPKTALGVLTIAKIDQIAAAINQGKADLLTKASGIGRKTAERIILELRGKLKSESSEQIVGRMESDLDIEEALVGLGYSRQQAKNAISKVDAKTASFEDRLKEALKKART